MTSEEIKDILKKRLKESRYLHCLGVAETSEKLARIYGANPQKAYLAGLVHDCAKGYTDDELTKKVAAYGIELDECALGSPQLLHSFVGARELKELFGIDDEEIFDAVYYHTVGKENMPVLTAIVYIADAIEPLRDYPGVDKIRELAFESLDKAIYMYTSEMTDYVVKKGQTVHPNAYKVIKFYGSK